MSSLPQTFQDRQNSRRPRVLFVNTRSAMGADVAVHLTLIQNFDPSEVEVHIVTNRNATDLQKTLEILRAVPHVRVQVMDLGNEMARGRGGLPGKIEGAWKNVGALISLLRLSWYVRAQKIDVLHATDRPRDAAFSTLLAKLTGRRNIIHVHIKWYPQIGRATTWALEKCSGVLAISQFTRHSLIEGGVPERKIYTVLNASDPVRFDPAKASRGLLRERFGLSDDTPLIGIVARIMIWKGHRELVEALALVRKVVPGVRLIIIGKEDALAAVSAESYEGQVRSRIAELGLEENVIWGGWIDAMPQVMADLDILAVPSWEEPFGLVVTEGMAMQRPVVGFDSGALPEIIENGVEGLLVPPREPEALATALITLLRDPNRRVAMGKKGRERVLKQFTPRRQAEEVVQVYRRVIGLPESAPQQEPLALRD